MKTESLTAGAQTVLTGARGRALMEQEGDLTEFLAHCFEAGAGAALLHPEHLPAGFFDLRTGVAGELLQRARTYRIRVALVATPEALPEGHFREMAREEATGLDFRICATREEALGWLA